MRRWIIGLGGCIVTLVALLVIGGKTSQAMPARLVATGPATAQAAAQGGSLTAPSSVLLVTRADSGKSYTVSVNTLIDVRIPIFPFSRLSYDGTILQPAYDLLPMANQGP